jgi:phage terminase large subunit
LLITKSSTNFIKEIKSYKWKVDKENKILDEPVKFNDHLMDAMRYAIYTHYKDKIGYSFKNKNIEDLVYSEKITHYDNLY